ncbi:hypothetical protein L0222_07025 [bacterium]|nr:hypothetical protein [bacterium]
MIIHTSENAISRLPQVQLDSSFPPRDIVHMILAGGPSQTLYNLSSGERQRAVDFLCREAGVIEEDAHGPYFAMDRPDRLNESLGVFAVSGVHFKGTPIVTTRGTEGTLEDLADSAKRTFQSDHREKSWSLMLFSTYPGITSEWVNEKGELLSVERILQSECAKKYGNGHCFGTHRLEGISFALRRFCLEEDVEPSHLNGAWLDAYQYIQEAVHLIKKSQRDDGSLQRCWFRKQSLPVTPLEWRETLKEVGSFKKRDESLVYATGHCLDAISSLAEFLPDDHEWMQNACYILAQTIETHWTAIGRKIGPLTHAIHALKLLDV